MTSCKRKRDEEEAEQKLTLDVTLHSVFQDSPRKVFGISSCSFFFISFSFARSHMCVCVCVCVEEFLLLFLFLRKVRNDGCQQGNLKKKDGKQSRDLVGENIMSRRVESDTRKIYIISHD